MLYKKMIETLSILFVSIASQFCSASYNDLIGSWVPIPYGEFEDIEVCFSETEVKYKWNRTGEVMASRLTNVAIDDDVLILSFYLDEWILRKIVFISRNSGNSLVGRIHMYSAEQSFNYFPIYLERSSEKCRIQELPINGDS